MLDSLYARFSPGAVFSAVRFGSHLSSTPIDRVPHFAEASLES
jgi:hypothetical protein